MSERKLYVKILPAISNPNADCPNDVIYVNDDFNPILIHNQYFTGHVVFRVADFAGITPKFEGKRKPVLENSAYFENRGRKFSLQVEGRFRHSWTGDDILFGVFFQKPIILHKGFQVAVSMARYIDPGLVGDLFSETPYLCSPITGAMNVMSQRLAPTKLSDASESTAKFYKGVFKNESIPALQNDSKTECLSDSADDSTISEDSSSNDDLDLPKAQARLMQLNLADGLNEADALCLKMEKIKLGCCKYSESTSEYNPLLLPPWEFGANSYLLEDLIKFPEKKSFIDYLTYKKEEDSVDSPEDRLKISKKNSKKRRQHFLSQSNRESFTFHPDYCYSFEFTSSYANLNELVLKLGVKVEVDKYINGQPVIYEARTRDGIVFFRVEFGLTEDFDKETST